MSVVNGRYLHFAAPIWGMLNEKQYGHGVSHGMGEAGYDIRIKQEITFTRDLFLRRCVNVWTPVGIKDDSELTQRREQGKFVIASSVEEFDMPTDLMGIVHDKSTWARRGLSVFNTVIEPGWRGFLTLELVYHGWKDLTIPAGAGIAQVIFHRLDAAAQYSGRYQNQADQPVPAKAAESHEAHEPVTSFRQATLHV